MNKLYIAKRKFTYESSGYVSDEEIKRDLAHTLIKDMELDDLCKLIDFTIIDPRTDKSVEKLINHTFSTEWERTQIIMNMQDRTLEYEAMIHIAD